MIRRPISWPFRRLVTEPMQQAMGESYIDKVKSIESASLIAYWPLNELTGTTVADQIDSPAQDGTATGVVWNDTTGADGGPVPRFDGVNDVIDVHSANFSSGLNGAEGSLSILLKVYEAATWTDGVLRYGLRFRGNSSNHIRIAKLAGNNTLLFEYRAGGVTSGYEHTISTVDWMHIVLTWSDLADEFKTYIDNSLVSTLTSIGTWSASSLESARTVLGGLDNTPTANVWDGWMQHIPIWTTPLSADDVSQLYGAL